MSRVARVQAALGIAATLASGAAHAGNEDELLVGNDAALVGGAVVATVHDGGAIWYNPGGLGGITRHQLDLTTSAYSLRFYRARTYLQSAQGARSGLSVAEFVTVPTQVSYVRPLSDALTIGFGFFQPRSSKLIINERLDASTGNLSSQWAVDAVSSYAEYALGAGLGFVPIAGLRLGAGLLGRWDTLTESANVSGNVASNGTTTQLLQVAEFRKQNLFGLEPIAGVQWDVTEQLTLGVNLRGPRLSLFNDGEERFQTSLASTTSGTPVLVASPTRQNIGGTGLEFVRWGRYYAGLAYRFERVRVSADADVQPGRVDVEAGVERRFAWNARAGVAYELSESVVLGAGLFTDRAADNRQRGTLATSGGNFYGGTAGIRLATERLLAPTEPADSLTFTSVFAFRYAQASAQAEALVVDPTQPNAAATLQLVRSDLTIRELAFYVGSGLYF
jgi:opacity protein-like surface antigen